MKTKRVDRIKELMDKRGLSPYEIQDKTGITATTIYNIINGVSKNPYAKTLQKLEEFLESNSIVSGSKKLAEQVSYSKETDVKPNVSSFSVKNFVDVFFLHQKEIEEYPAFAAYLLSVERHGIIKYQHQLMNDKE